MGIRRRSPVTNCDADANVPGTLATPEDAYETGLFTGAMRADGPLTGVLARYLMRRRGIEIKSAVHQAGRAAGHRAGNPPGTTRER